MKNTYTLCYFLLVCSLIMLLVGCASFDATVPDGFDPKYEKRTFSIQFNDLHFDTKLSYDDGKPHKVIDKIDVEELNGIFQAHCRSSFINSSRFVVLSRDVKNTDANPAQILVKVTPFITVETGTGYKRKGNTLKTGEGFNVHTHLFAELSELNGPEKGITWNKAVEIDGASITIRAPRYYNGMIDYKPSDIMTQSRKSTTDAIRQLKVQLNQLFPITCPVVNWIGETFTIQGGTNDGMSQTDGITLYYARKGEPMVLLANMKNSIIGANETTVTAACWNDKDPRARQIKKQILSSNNLDAVKNLRRCLFIFCNKQ